MTTGKDLLRIHCRQNVRHGKAEYVPENNTIRLHVYPHNFYEIDLDRCVTPEQTLDWTFHISKKTWCDGETLKNFVRCLIIARRDQ